MIDIKEIKYNLEQQNPLILNLTNTVTMDFMANALLALGASPIMSNDKEDALALATIASALNINIGTLNSDFLDIAHAVAQSNNKKKPLILDPVGAGATPLRSKASADLLPYATVLRGNASEITAIHHSFNTSKGVDSTLESENVVDFAFQISQEYDITVAVSGKIDYIVYQDSCLVCPFGHEFMPKITGTGCVLTSIIAAFNSVEPDSFKATYSAHLFYTLCGELAYQKGSSLGTFKNNFIDTLHEPDFDYIQNKMNSIEVLRRKK